MPAYTFDDPLLHKAVNFYGENRQYTQLLEEMAELTVAVSHVLHERSTDYTNVLEEIGDVYLTLEKVSMLLGRSRVKEHIRKSEDKLRRHMMEDDRTYYK